MFYTIHNKIDEIENPVLRGIAATGFISAIFAAGVGGIASPFLIYMAINSDDLENDIHTLDKGTSSVFQSVSDCQEQGLLQSTCQASHDKALDIATTMGSQLSYNNAEECAAIHNVECEKDYFRVGAVASPYYVAPMIAWQMTADNPDIVAPLYGTTTPGQVMRKDGQLFTLDIG